MKLDNNDGASALEESATPPPCLGVHIGMILSVLLQILIPFAIIYLSIQMTIDPFESIFTHAEHPALRQSSEMSSGTALQRFPYDSIDNRGDNLVSKTFREPSIRQELMRACEDPPDDPSFETMVVDAKRGGEGKVYSPADHGPCVPAFSPRPSSRNERGEIFLVTPMVEYYIFYQLIKASSCVNIEAIYKPHQFKSLGGVTK